MKLLNKWFKALCDTDHVTTQRLNDSALDYAKYVLGESWTRLLGEITNKL